MADTLQNATSLGGGVIEIGVDLRLLEKGEKDSKAAAERIGKLSPTIKPQVDTGQAKRALNELEQAARGAETQIRRLRDTAGIGSGANIGFPAGSQASQILASRAGGVPLPARPPAIPGSGITALGAGSGGTGAAVAAGSAAAQTVMQQMAESAAHYANSASRSGGLSPLTNILSTRGLGRAIGNATAAFVVNEAFRVIGESLSAIQLNDPRLLLAKSDRPGGGRSIADSNIQRLVATQLGNLGAREGILSAVEDIPLIGSLVRFGDAVSGGPGSRALERAQAERLAAGEQFTFDQGRRISADRAGFIGGNPSRIATENAQQLSSFSTEVKVATKALSEFIRENGFFGRDITSGPLKDQFDALRENVIDARRNLIQQQDLGDDRLHNIRIAASVSAGASILGGRSDLARASNDTQQALRLRFAAESGQLRSRLLTDETLTPSEKTAQIAQLADKQAAEWIAAQRKLEDGRTLAAEEGAAARLRIGHNENAATLKEFDAQTHVILRNTDRVNLPVVAEGRQSQRDLIVQRQAEETAVLVNQASDAARIAGFIGRNQTFSATLQSNFGEAATAAIGFLDPSKRGPAAQLLRANLETSIAIEARSERQRTASLLNRRAVAQDTRGEFFLTGEVQSRIGGIENEVEFGGPAKERALRASTARAELESLRHQLLDFHSGGIVGTNSALFNPSFGQNPRLIQDRARAASRIAAEDRRLAGVVDGGDQADRKEETDLLTNIRDGINQLVDLYNGTAHAGP